MKKIFSKELAIGFCVILALCILFFGINFLKGTKLFGGSNYYYANFDNVEGLAEAAPVTLNGFKVGEVEDIRYDYEHPGNVVVTISLDNALKLPQGTMAIMTSDLLGTGSIMLNLGTGSEMVTVGSTLPSKINGGLMASVTETLLPEVAGIMPKVDSLLVNINTLVTSQHIQASLANLETITADMARLSAQLNRVAGQLQPLMQNANKVAANAGTITDDLTVVTDQLRQVPVDSLVTDMQATINNLRELTEQLNNPDSSLGQLTHDSALYDNLNNAVTSLDSLFVDIKKNPKRYVTIKVF